MKSARPQAVKPAEIDYRDSAETNEAPLLSAGASSICLVPGQRSKVPLLTWVRNEDHVALVKGRTGLTSPSLLSRTPVAAGMVATSTQAEPPPLLRLLLRQVAWLKSGACMLAPYRARRSPASVVMNSIDSAGASAFSCRAPKFRL